MLIPCFHRAKTRREGYLLSKALATRCQVGFEYIVAVDTFYQKLIKIQKLYIKTHHGICINFLKPNHIAQ